MGCFLEAERAGRVRQMGEAREVMDRITDAYFSKDMDAAAKLYAPDAVAVAPDAGELRGRDQIVAWSKELFDAFPDATYEPVNEYEAGNTAIDEGYFVGPNTGPLQGPTGKPFLPPASPCGGPPA